MKYIEYAMDNPIELTVIVLAMIGCGIIGFGALLISDKILK